MLKAVIVPGACVHNFLKLSVLEILPSSVSLKTERLLVLRPASNGPGARDPRELRDTSQFQLVR